MNSLVACCDDRLDSQQSGSLGCPVATATGAILLSCENDERGLLRRILMGCIKDAETLTVRLVERLPTLDSRKHEVLDPNVGERAPCHDAVIATATAVAVEVFEGYLVLAEESTSRGFRFDRSSR